MADRNDNRNRLLYAGNVRIRFDFPSFHIGIVSSKVYCTKFQLNATNFSVQMINQVHTFASIHQPNDISLLTIGNWQQQQNRCKMKWVEPLMEYRLRFVLFMSVSMAFCLVKWDAVLIKLHFNVRQMEITDSMADRISAHCIALLFHFGIGNEKQHQLMWGNKKNNAKFVIDPLWIEVFIRCTNHRIRIHIDGGTKQQQKWHRHKNKKNANDSSDSLIRFHYRLSQRLQQRS